MYNLFSSIACGALGSLLIKYPLGTSKCFILSDGRKCCLNLVTFKSSALSSMYIWSVIWFSIYQLRSFTYDSNLRLMLITYGTPKDEGKIFYSLLNWFFVVEIYLRPYDFEIKANAYVIIRTVLDKYVILCNFCR